MDNKRIQKRYILTVTLNPAIDTMLVFKPSGRIARIKRQIRSAGGKSINVSRALNSFGCPNWSTGIVGGANGLEICRLAGQEKIHNQFYKATGESRNNIILFVPGLGGGKRVFSKAPMIDRNEYVGFEELYKKLIDRADLVVLSGSVLNGISMLAYVRLIKLSRQRNIPVFLDAGQEALREGLKARPEFIKPNRREIEELFGVKIMTLDDARKAVLRLKSFKVENIFISLGSKGAIGCNRNDLWYAKAPTIKVLNSVGCGDAFVGAVCAGFIKKMNFRDCLKLAVAAGTVNAMTLIPGRIDRVKVNKMADRITLKQLCI